MKTIQVGASSVRAELGGFDVLTQRLMSLGDRVYRRHARRAVTKASQVIARNAKQGAPRETGLLKLSIGQRVKDYPANRTTVGVVGPRRGFRRVVAPDVRGRLTHVRRSQAGASPAAHVRNPAKYAHLVELGRGPVRAKRVKILRTVTGRWLGRQVGPAQGTHFLRRGFQGGRASAEAIVAIELAAGIEMEAARIH